MTYYVQVLKNNRVIGRLRRGKVDCYGTSYNSVAEAKRCARVLLKKFPLNIFECQVRAHKDNVLAISLQNARELLPLAGSFSIGEFTLTMNPKGSLYIKHCSGEGGEFNKERFLKVIQTFYYEEF